MKFRLIEKLAALVIVCLLLGACGQGMQDWFNDRSSSATTSGNNGGSSSTSGNNGSSSSASGSEDVTNNSSAIYTQADLTGTWYYFKFENAGDNAGLWERVTLSVDTNGTGTVTSALDSRGKGADWVGMKISFSLSASGVVTMPQRSSSWSGCMSSGKDIVVATMTPDANATPPTAGLAVMVKAGSGFKQSDLTGNWKGHQLVASSTSREWQRGDIAIDSGGAWTVTNVQRSSGSGTSGKVVVMTMNSNGVITAPTNSFYGAMTSDKNLVVCTYLNGDGTTAFLLLVRTGGTGFSIADLAGSWRINNLTISAQSNYWNRSLGVIDSNGNMKGYIVTGSGAETNSGNEPPLTVSPAGIINRVSSQKGEGILALNKKLIIYTDTDSTGTNGDQYRLGIFMK